ncbi:cobalt-precorrin-5B (C(1))-methyltransferase CbiD [uncultured Porphyromonas sp.]|uniref:cobalt-precorrin-5B (C(1))-methyltransferase CbiD n=1 Tax=uncultured Porphyromonas sp. TaxID=159274 RepID=UPI0025F978DD|nr:cobalt-precorrin-5B (C(1))-methyltransferase CbiD [uncultured Porphyromonas sp.]
MILIIGGTTEGRKALEVCEEAGKPFYYSTRGASQELTMHHGIRLEGGMNGEEMAHFCTERAIALIVDAAHPFAMGVHQSVAQCVSSLQLPVIRYERTFPALPASVVVLDSFDAALTYLLKHQPQRLLALTGVNSVERLRAYWTQHETYLRVMPIAETEERLRQSNFPPERLVYYNKEQCDRELFATLRPDMILLKESGDTSGFAAKVEEALALGITVLVIRRPQIPYPATVTVEGPVGLRRSIERLLGDDFFPQRIGLTTGTTATAAATAALLTLLNEESYSEVTVTLPQGERVPFPIQHSELTAQGARAVAIKDAGSDPDVTDGAEIVADLSLTQAHSGVAFLQGEGVGRVTLPGIGLEVGEPAVNPVPRQMVRQALGALVDLSQVGIDLTISVPKGRKLAQSTFNPRLGILDGISILGTTGVVRPYSSEAFVESIRRELEVSKSVYGKLLVLNSGGRSERYLKGCFPDLPANAFVQYGNFIGETLSLANELAFPQITLGIMIGKAVKLAAGELDTHSKKVVMDKAFITALASASGATEAQKQQINEMTLARELWQIFPDGMHPLYQSIVDHCYQVCKPLVPSAQLEVLLIPDSQL